MFDLSRDVILAGTITTISFRNPHIYFAIDVAGADGRTRTQEIEAGPASNLAPLGIDASSLKSGEHVTVQVKPNRRGEGEVLG